MFLYTVVAVYTAAADVAGEELRSESVDEGEWGTTVSRRRALIGEGGCGVTKRWRRRKGSRGMAGMQVRVEQRCTRTQFAHERTVFEVEAIQLCLATQVRFSG